MTDENTQCYYTHFELHGAEHVLKFVSERAADLYMENEFGVDFIYDVVPQSELETA